MLLVDETPREEATAAEVCELGPVLLKQIEQNRCTSANWAAFSGHRERLTGLIGSIAPKRDSTLCVLGAGNCNDLDLAILARRFREIHLVDLDAHAVTEGMRRQRVDDHAGIVPHGGVDLTGIGARVAGWYARPATQAAINSTILEADRSPPRQLGGPFDVVVSSTVLTQLIDVPVSALGPHNPRVDELVFAIRRAHLRLLCELTSSGGAAILVTDIVSSDTCDTLRDVAENELPALARALIRERNFFTGTNPYVLQTLLRRDSEIGVHVEKLILGAPWIWWISTHRCYLVVAVGFYKR